MSEYNYFKVFFQVKGSPKSVFLKAPPWGGDDYWIRDRIKEMYPDADTGSERVLRYTEEEYKKMSKD